MPRKQTLKEISAQLRDPRHIDILRGLLKRYGKRLQVARLTVKDGYLHYAGTTGNMISYWMRGVNYLRTKGTLDKKAFKKRKCFEGSRKSAKRFALGQRAGFQPLCPGDDQPENLPSFLLFEEKINPADQRGKNPGGSREYNDRLSPVVWADEKRAKDEEARPTFPHL